MWRRPGGADQDHSCTCAVATRLGGGQSYASNPRTPAQVAGRRLRLGRRVLDGRERTALMAAVAERLLRALAARTPEVVLSGLDFDGVRALLRNNRFCHDGLLQGCRDDVPTTRDLDQDLSPTTAWRLGPKSATRCSRPPNQRRTPEPQAQNRPLPARRDHARPDDPASFVTRPDQGVSPVPPVHFDG